MVFSIRGLFAFELSLEIPRLWKRRTAAIAADYELERFFIAGFQYHDGPELLEGLEPGMDLTLIHELDNPHDPRAVAFRFAGSHLGYVPRSAIEQSRRCSTSARQFTPGSPRSTPTRIPGTPSRSPFS